MTLKSPVIKITSNAAITYIHAGLSPRTGASLEPGTRGLTLDVLGIGCVDILSITSRILIDICNNPTGRKVLKPHLDII